MTEMTDKRVASLPKWAQEALDDRRREIAALRAEISHLRGLVKPGRIYYQVSMNEPVYIPEEARIFFLIGEMEGDRRKGDEIEIDLDLNHKMINVRSSFGGVGVLPQAENSVILFSQSRYNIAKDEPWTGLMEGEKKTAAKAPARSQRCAKCDEMKDATENLGVVAGWVCKDCRDAEKTGPDFPPALAGGDR